MTGTPRPDPVSTKQQRIAELARNCPDMAFTNLAHHIDIEWMLTAHAQTRKDGAVGVDGQTAEEYEVNLEANLQNLLDRAKSGTYVAPPVRRVHIPKAGSPSETRPLGIPTYEDKILQRAVLMVLEPVYETDFLGRLARVSPRTRCSRSIGLTVETGDEAGRRLDRGRRSAKIFRHDRPWPSTGVPQATGARWCDPATDRQMAQRWRARGRGSYDSRRRHATRRCDQPPPGQHCSCTTCSTSGSSKEVRPRLKGEAFLIRYADDFVIGAAREDDARRIMEVLPKRMSKYGLTVHPEKTRLVRFQPPQARRLRNRGTGTHPNRRHLTFWDLPTTGDDRSEANGWSNGRRRRADSSVRSQRCRNGVERICTFRSRNSTRSSRKSCEATTGTTGSLATSSASRNSGREREGSGDGSCLGDAEAEQ